MEKAKNDFDKASKDEKTVKDFGFINEKSVGVDKNIKEKALSIKKFPTTEIVKSTDNKFWVIFAEKKSVLKYKELDNEFKKGISQRLEQGKLLEEFKKEIGVLEKKYNFVKNMDYFKPATKEEAPVKEAKLVKAA